jgi:hypothetical protein
VEVRRSTHERRLHLRLIRGLLAVHAGKEATGAPTR